MAGFTFTRKAGSTGTDGNIQTFGVAAAHATILAVGDPAVITGIGDAALGTPQVDIGNAATANTGVIVSIDFTLAGEQLSDTGLAALTAGTVKINTDPLSSFEIESDATLAVADVGLNAGVNIVAATKVGGLTQSNVTLDSSTKATTITLPYRILALLPGETSEVLGDRALVRPNATTQSTGAAGI